MITVQGLEDYSLKDIQDVVLSHIDHLREGFHFEDLDFSIKAIVPFGSRITGHSKVNSMVKCNFFLINNSRQFLGFL
jgi:hypothetical protein